MNITAQLFKIAISHHKADDLEWKRQELIKALRQHDIQTMRRLQ